MKATMKFFNHEGVEYVTVFPDDRDPVTVAVDKVLSWCLLQATEKGIILFTAERIFGESRVKETVFPYSTPNIAQAILEEVGAKGILDRVNHPDIYQHTKKSEA